MKRFIPILRFFVAIFSVIIFSLGNSYAQNNVGIGTLNPAKDALLDLSAHDKGLLIPRLTTEQRLSINAESNGLFVYDTDSSKFFYWVAPENRWQILDDNSSLNELIKKVSYDTGSHILSIQDNGGLYNVDLSMLDNRKGYQKISLSKGKGTLTLDNDGRSVQLADSSATNEIQYINRSNDTIYLSDGGFIVLPFDKVYDGDSSIRNEIQIITKDEDQIGLSLGGGNITLFNVSKR
jgi:hypothetical protein